MQIINANPTDLRDALLQLRSTYLQLAEPRRWYTALVCSVLVKSGELAEWTDWDVEPPAGSDIKITGAASRVIDTLFGTDPLTALHPAAVNALGHPKRIIVDPLRQPGQAIADPTFCVVIGNRRWNIPVSDAGWVWNNSKRISSYGPSSAEIKHSNDYGAQQGILCHMSANYLFDLGPDGAASTISLARRDCEERDKERFVCNISGTQCASKGSGQEGPGGPRAMIPAIEDPDKRLLTPGAFERMLMHANPDYLPLPSRNAMALVVDYLSKGHGFALDANRLLQLSTPQHLDMLFDT